MTPLDLVIYSLGAVYALAFVGYSVAYWRTGSRLKREHPELWESLGRPPRIVRPMDSDAKAAWHDFFWKKGYTKVDDQVLQAHARRTLSLQAAVLILLAVMVALFLFKHFALK